MQGVCYLSICRTSICVVLPQRIDFEAKTVVFEDVHGNGIEQSYDLLVGADGEKSFVRQQLQLLDDTIVTKIYRCKRGYKSIRRLPIVDGSTLVARYMPASKTPSCFYR